MKRSITPPRSKVKPATEYQYVWLWQHLFAFLFSLGQILRAPLPSLMTIAVIGIALALPTGLYALLENARHVSRDWDNVVQISLFLKPEVTNEQAQFLKTQLLQHPDIKDITLITKDEALREYRTLSGFGEALDLLGENPLPAVLVVQPKTNLATIQTVLDNLNQLPSVEIVQSDMQWLERLFAIMEVMRRGVWILSGLLALAVLLIVGNTIRLSIYSRREEIEVNKLFGATDAFVRRPFLYIGFWYGLIGGGSAWILVNVAFLLLTEPVKQLATLYHSHFELMTLDISSGLILLVGSILLGLSGAWIAVGRHLKAIQPR